MLSEDTVMYKVHLNFEFEETVERGSSPAEVYDCEENKMGPRPVATNDSPKRSEPESIDDGWSTGQFSVFSFHYSNKRL